MPTRQPSMARRRPQTPTAAGQRQAVRLPLPPRELIERRDDAAGERERWTALADWYTDHGLGGHDRATRAQQRAIEKAATTHYRITYPDPRELLRQPRRSDTRDEPPPF